MATSSASVKKSPRALAFDVFGTVVDWHGGIAREAAALAGRHGIDGDWPAFANAWRAGYAPAMDRVRRGEQPWAHIDTLHRAILDSILDAHGLATLSEAEREHLNRGWHRLPPWPDTVAGLTRLKRRFTITTLSNGNFSLLTNMPSTPACRGTASSAPNFSATTSPTPKPTSVVRACSTSLRAN